MRQLVSLLLYHPAVVVVLVAVVCAAAWVVGAFADRRGRRV